MDFSFLTSYFGEDLTDNIINSIKHNIKLMFNCNENDISIIKSRCDLNIYIKNKLIVSYIVA